MKKIFKYIIPCLAIATVFVGCKDEDDSKAYIDSLYETGTSEVISTSVAPAVADYQSATLSAAFSDISDIVECGFQVSTSEDFANAQYYAAEIDSVAKTYSASVSGLEGSTTYYSRGYVITKGGGTVYGDTQTFTTPAIPLYEINSTFLVHELEYDSDNDQWITQLDEDGEDVGYYLMSIEFVDDAQEDVIITGFLGFDSEIAGTYDAETQTITVEAPQVVGTHPKYGEMFFYGLDDVPPSSYLDTVTFTFSPMGGTLVSSYYSLNVSAGYFGFYRFEAVPYEAEE